MKYIRKGNQRGAVNLGWLKSQHTFSFGEYYDPDHMGVSVLRVINDDIVQPGKGFATHGHDNMEIISYVVKGSVAHKDSEGNEAVIPAGDVQIMSAGSGIRHSEYNPSQSEAVNFLQIWIQPSQRNVNPAYGQMTIQDTGTLTPLVTPDGREGTLKIHQNASLYKVMLDVNESLTLRSDERCGYFHLVKGAITVKGQSFVAGDAFAIENDVIELSANEPLEALWFDLP